MNTQALVESRHEHASALRRRLHQIPELGFQEVKTAAAIRGELDKLGVKYVAGVKGAETATIAWIGDPQKKCVALRSDIDALPILERTGKSWCSTHDGCMHACGHDGHIATLFGTAAALKTVEDDLPVCVQ